MKRKQLGFSLIELVIVVGIILVIAVLAIPRLLQSKINANEASAVASLRTILTANTTYLASYNNGFSPDLPTLSGNPPADCKNANLLDAALASGKKSGYTFIYVLANPVATPPPGCAPGGNAFTVQATPVALGSSGQRSFCIDETDVIRFNPSGALIAAPCTSSSMSPLE